MKNVWFFFYIYAFLEDAFIQSDLQMRKSN